MSKRINVNPDHYKTAGRERQGEDVVVELEKQKLSRAEAGDRKRRRRRR
jgi:hypothetical protein